MISESKQISSQDTTFYFEIGIIWRNSKFFRFPKYPLLDPTDLSSWLADIGREFRQYGFNLIQAGVDRKFLPHLTDTHLKTDCQVIIEICLIWPKMKNLEKYIFLPLDFERRSSYENSRSY